jgi:hypothetical protein
MEAVAALALACNVIQMVQLASKVILVLHETHKNGAAEENIAVENTSKQLHDLSKTLSTSLNSTQNQLPTTSAESQLQELALESLKIAKELQSELNHLKSKKGPPREFAEKLACY